MVKKSRMSLLLSGMLMISSVAQGFSWNPFFWARAGASLSDGIPDKVDNSIPFLIKKYKQLAERLDKIESEQWIVKKLVDTSKKSMLAVSSYMISYLQYMRENKFESCSVMCAVACMYVSFRVIYLQFVLSKPGVWSLWHANQDFSKLSPEEFIKVTQALVHEIQVHYLNLSDVADVVGPIKQFIADINCEMEQIKEFHALGKFLQLVQLSSLLDQTLVASLETRMHRLSFIKNMCYQWVANAKCSCGQEITIPA